MRFGAYVEVVLSVVIEATASRLGQRDLLQADAQRIYRSAIRSVTTASFNTIGPMNITRARQLLESAMVGHSLAAFGRLRWSAKLTEMSFVLMA